MVQTQIHQYQQIFPAPVAEVWPLIADTARYNQSTGLPPYQMEDIAQADGSVKHVGRMTLGKKPFAFHLAWEEPPPEFITHQFYRYERRFFKGWLAQLNTEVRLEPEGENRCKVTFTLTLTARPKRGGLLKFLKMGERAGQDFARISKDIADFLAGDRPQAFNFEVTPLPPERLVRLDRLIDLLRDDRHSHGLAPQLREFLIQAPDLDVRRFRPLALADNWHVPPRHAIELCLSGVKSGLLESRWDILCPRCRGAKVSMDALDRGLPKAHCASCAVDFSIDFQKNVEMTFRPAPAIREVADGEFCLLGPMSVPHVRLQIRVPPHQRLRQPVELPDGLYRVRSVEPGPELEWRFDGRGGVSVELSPTTMRVEAKPDFPGQVELANSGEVERHIVIEDVNWRSDALTFGAVTSLQAFRDLFPQFSVRPGDEPPVSHLTLMFTDLAGSTALYEKVGDAAAYALVRRHFLFLSDLVRAHNGALVKTIGDAVMAAFADPADAYRCGRAILVLTAGFNRAMAAEGSAEPMALKIGLHAGPLVAVMLNEHLDYFGRTANIAARVQGEAQPDEMLISDSLFDDILVREALHGQGVRESRMVRGIDQPISVLRLSPPHILSEAEEIQLVRALLSDLGIDAKTWPVDLAKNRGEMLGLWKEDLRFSAETREKLAAAVALSAWANQSAPAG